MKRRDESEKDALLNFIDPEHIEKAPEGFTSRVMENIRFQPVPEKKSLLGFRSYAIPVISALVVVLLVITALIVPGTSSTGFPFAETLRSITVPSVNISFDIFSGISVPAWLPYMFLAILLLLMLDKALWGFFHREKK